jgi:hypothetical protein
LNVVSGANIEMQPAVRRPQLVTRRLGHSTRTEIAKQIIAKRKRPSSSWRCIVAFSIFFHVSLAHGMKLSYPDGTEISGIPTIPRGRRVLLGFAGEYDPGKSIKEGDAISIVASTKNCAETDDITIGMSSGVAAIKVQNSQGHIWFAFHPSPYKQEPLSKCSYECI